MEGFLKLTTERGTPIWINQAYVIGFETIENRTVLILSNRECPFGVKESTEQIAQMLVER